MSDIRNEKKSKNKALGIFFTSLSVVFIGVAVFNQIDRGEIIGSEPQDNQLVVEKTQCLKAGRDRGFLVEDNGNEMTFYAPNFRRNNYTSIMSGILGTANMCVGYKLKENNGACIGVGCEENKGVGIPLEFTMVREE